MSDLDLRVLKNVLSNKDIALEIVNTVDSKLFSSDIRSFVNSLYLYVNKYNDIPTVRILEEFTEKNVNDVLSKNISTMWNNIFNIESSLNELKPDLDKLRLRYSESEIITLQRDLSTLKSGNIDVDEVLSRLNKTQQSINEINTDTVYLNESVDKYTETFKNKFNYKRNNPDDGKGLMTKYSIIDFATNGLKDGDFFVVAGESGQGKSLLLQNIAAQVWMQDNMILNNEFTQGKNIIYFSLEMPYEDCFNRLISKMSGVPARSIENAKIKKDEASRVKECMDFMKKYPYKFTIVDMVDASAGDIETILRKSPIKYDAVFVDYLGIMTVQDSKNNEEADWQKQGIIAYELRRIARKFKIPVFSAVQINTKGSKENASAIGPAKISRSGQIITHLTHCIQIETRQNEHLYPDLVCHVIKNRKGPKMKMTFKKDLKCCNILDDNQNVEEGFLQYQSDISDDIEKYADLEF